MQDNGTAVQSKMRKTRRIPQPEIKKIIFCAEHLCLSEHNFLPKNKVKFTQFLYTTNSTYETRRV
jgi:hypothetical protein